jgi:hypothetical protein
MAVVGHGVYRCLCVFLVCVESTKKQGREQNCDCTLESIGRSGLEIIFFGLGGIVIVSEKIGSVA